METPLLNTQVKPTETNHKKKGSNLVKAGVFYLRLSERCHWWILWERGSTTVRRYIVDCLVRRVRVCLHTCVYVCTQKKKPHCVCMCPYAERWHFCLSTVALVLQVRAQRVNAKQKWSTTLNALPKPQFVCPSTSTPSSRIVKLCQVSSIARESSFLLSFQYLPYSG